MLTQPPWAVPLPSPSAVLWHDCHTAQQNKRGVSPSPTLRWHTPLLAPPHMHAYLVARCSSLSLCSAAACASFASSACTLLCSSVTSAARDVVPFTRCSSTARRVSNAASAFSFSAMVCSHRREHTRQRRGAHDSTAQHNSGHAMHIPWLR